MPAKALVDVFCRRGHYVASIPMGTPYKAYCHRCQYSWMETVRMTSREMA